MECTGNRVQKNVKIKLSFQNVQAIPPKGPQAEDV